MPITASDIQFKGSGASNLGGAISGVDVSGALHAFFDRVDGIEAASGDIEYRCLYVKNNHGSLTLYDARVWVDSNTPSADTIVAIGLGSAAVNGEEQTVVDESTAPIGPTFSAPSSWATGLVIGDIPPGQHKAVWIRRTVAAAAAAYNADNFTLAVQGDSGA